MLIQIYIIDALKYALFFFAIYFVLRCIYLIAKKKDFILHNEILYCISFIYIMTLFSQTIFPIIQIGHTTSGRFIFHVYGYGNGTINLIPFQTIFTFLFQNENVEVSNWRQVCDLNVLANIGLFIPYGFLAWFYPQAEKSLKKIMISGAVLSIGIELVQIFVQRGTDIDDVILNCVGVFLGYIIVAELSDIFSKFKKVPNSKNT